MARRRVREGSRTSSPSVAMRAYPAKAKNSSPAAVNAPSGPPATGSGISSVGTAATTAVSSPAPSNPLTTTSASTASVPPTRAYALVAVHRTPAVFSPVTTRMTTTAATTGCDGST